MKTKNKVKAPLKAKHSARTTTHSNGTTSSKTLASTRTASSGFEGKHDYTNIEVFNFEEKWDLVRPFLNDPQIEALLHINITQYRLMRAEECVGQGLSPDSWLIPYNPEDGPWSNNLPMYWVGRADDKMEAAIEAGQFESLSDDASEDEEYEYTYKYEEFAERFYPQPDTFEWYQLLASCHWLYPWHMALAKRVLPQLSWRVMKGERHSLVYGCEADGRIKVLFDILNFQEMSAKELIKFAS